MDLLTLVVAAYGAVVATASMVVAVLAFRVGGPVVEVHSVPFLRSGVPGVTIKVVNRGRGEITIDDIKVFATGSLEAHHHLAREAISAKPTGPDMPFRMQGKSTQQWMCSLAEMQSETIALDVDAEVSAANTIFTAEKQVLWMRNETE